eukprot:3753230-Ditylum_brightwellii.AAC.1
MEKAAPERKGTKKKTQLQPKQGHGFPPSMDSPQSPFGGISQQEKLTIKSQLYAQQMQGYPPLSPHHSVLSCQDFQQGCSHAVP